RVSFWPVTEALALRAATGTGTAGSVALGTPTAVNSLSAVNSLFVMGTVAVDVAVAAVAMVKGETPAGDRIWLASADGTSQGAVAHVIHDLPHLVVESAFGIDDGLWGTLADASSDDRLNGRDCAGHAVARAAASAVVNLWRHGPNTPSGVRDRLRAAARHETWAAARIEDLAARLDDDTIRAARIGVRRLYRAWRTLPAGGALRLTWPLLVDLLVPWPPPPPGRAARRQWGTTVTRGDLQHSAVPARSFVSLTSHDDGSPGDG
ncbi:MAG TPA: hypothetical protein VI365_35745, partial [Trebonia sp.]